MNARSFQELNMERRAFIRVLGGGTVAAATGLGLAGCSADLPPEALAAWAGPGAAPVATADPRHWLLAHAILAPHSHNLQSWLVDLREADAITLYCDRSRLLPETDPFSRQMMMSQGTFLEALDLAAREIGLVADITLFPQGTPGPEQLTDAPTAHIRLRRDQGSHPDPLFRQILLRRTNRSPYEARSPATARPVHAPAATGLAGIPRAGRVAPPHPCAVGGQRAGADRPDVGQGGPCAPGGTRTPARRGIAYPPGVI
jgi:hypothetical protein